MQKIVLEPIEGPIVFIEKYQVQPLDPFTNWRGKIATFIGTPHLLDGELEVMTTWQDIQMETFGLKVGLLTWPRKTPQPGNPLHPDNLCRNLSLDRLNS